ncbi:TonB-dependent receptor [Novosphingobium sp. YJ-S2-02]|uniref:TonB-dependent receptor n=1 Tax=Novosphingobium aureum TaxID=2792964 RepID=A0A931MKL0_9SPHN|nr:TonB-dependent receptor [Novosphingobium aureum]MBH0112091.1 TonB-dependent receptor [Novosphingobium aureum]
MNNLNRFLISASLVPAVIAAAPAQAQQRIINVPAGEANKTIPEFARQSGLEILAPAERLGGVKTPAIIGTVDVRERLQRLILPAGLEISTFRNGIVTLRYRERGRFEGGPSARAGLTFASASGGGLAMRSAGRVPTASAAAAASSAQPVEDELPGEILVTATKQATSISRVPMSITALPTEEMDKRNIRSFADVVRTVPALSLQSSPIADRIPNISIRGVASSNGAPTTGIYLDDTPLQKRNAIGISGSGTPTPQLFDLERVEVLRGPQGTLFGGSSLGGTIRFITPTPSLVDSSLYGRAEVGFIKSGGTTYDLGLALGIPLVEDRLGLRVSGTLRRFGGYIDHVDRLTGETLAKDTNTTDEFAFRGALLFQASDALAITPSVYYSRNRQDDADTQWETVPETTFGGYTYPEATFGPYETGINCNYGDIYVDTAEKCTIVQPRTTEIFLPSLKLEYDLGGASLTSVTSYLHDKTWGRADYTYVEPANFQGGFPFVSDLTSYQSTPIYENTRDGFIQELRMAGTNTGRFSWIAGVYFAHYDNNSNYHIIANLEDLTQATFGITPEQLMGVGVEPGNITYHRDQNLEETSLAAFGEASYELVDKLKLIAGVRVSREKFAYDQVTAGTFAGFLEPTTQNGGLTQGTVKETPVTPKFGLQYQIDRSNMVYATVAKGFRVGGVNQPPPAARCGADLEALGISSSPDTYGADSLWSYEVGAKLRSANAKASLAGSAYYIDWSNIQTAYGLPTCGFGYTINGGKAVSKGFDMQVAFELFEGLRLDGQVAYTDAKYTQDVIGPEPGFTTYVADGDALPVPDWSFNLGFDYVRPLGGFEAFLHADYQHNSAYQNSSGPFTASFSPDTYRTGATNFVTARAGLGRDGWKVSLYIDNLFNSRDVMGRYGGRTSCSAGGGDPCASYRSYVYPYQYGTLRPRTIGATFTIRR